MLETLKSESAMEEGSRSRGHFSPEERFEQRPAGDNCDYWQIGAQLEIF